MDDITQMDFKARQQLFVEELNALQEKYGVRLEIRTVTENHGDNAVLVKGEVYAASVPG